jgi:pimeloyl-ACP methyl ester carboxylesterase
VGPRVTAVAIAAILLVTACSRNSFQQAKTIPSSSPSASRVSKIAWASCGGGFECGTVQVPLDYSNPQKDTISIALIRKPAINQAARIGSVLTNPGGPGASGVQFLRDNSSAMVGLNDRFDLVGFDPRGIGASAPVRCLDGVQEDAYNALDSVLDDSAEKQAAITADKNFAAGCQQLSARVLPYLDTESAARDMDVIRAALGDNKLTYLGFSYGTFLGEHYAHLFPTHIRAFALDGVVDPTLSANDLLLQQVVGFEKNLQAFLADCRARPSCTYARGGDPGAKLNALMQRLDTTPLTVGNRALTRGLALIGVLVTLYDQSSWQYLDRALTLADQGNGSILMQLADLYTGRNADGSYSNENDANYAVNCLDRPVPPDIASYDALGPLFAKASPFFGPATQYSNLPCAYWPVNPKGVAGPITADGAPPILLVGGTNDPATPYSWAVSVHQQLTSSILLTRNGNGHVSYFASTCAQQAEDAYLINLKLPVDGATC